MNINALLTTKILKKEKITEEEVKKIILEDEELQIIYNQNALITVILSILVSKGMTTAAEIEKLKDTALETIINRDAVTYAKNFNEVIDIDE